MTSHFRLMSELRDVLHAHLRRSGSKPDDPVLAATFLLGYWINFRTATVIEALDLFDNSLAPMIERMIRAGTGRQ